MTVQLRQQIAQEAARILCEEQLADYNVAKRKALKRLGIQSQTALPENVLIQTAVLDYLRLFGGSAYSERLLQRRLTAVKVMRRLEAFQPRLVGAVVSGAITEAHHIQLHAFSEKAEALELFLHHHGIRCEQADRSYRYPDGSECNIPLTCFELDGIGIDVAMFELSDIPHSPINPADARPYKRLDFAGAQALAAGTAEQSLQK